MLFCSFEDISILRRGSFCVTQLEALSIDKIKKACPSLLAAATAAAAIAAGVAVAVAAAASAGVAVAAAGVAATAAALLLLTLPLLLLLCLMLIDRMEQMFTQLKARAFLVVQFSRAEENGNFYLKAFSQLFFKKSSLFG